MSRFSLLTDKRADYNSKKTFECFHDSFKNLMIGDCSEDQIIDEDNYEDSRIELKATGHNLVLIYHSIILIVYLI